MDKILAIREKRAALWEQANTFLDEHTQEGSLSAEDAKAYEQMENEVLALGKGIERLERQAILDAEMAKPTAVAITNLPGASLGKEQTGRASDAYRAAMLKALRTNFRQVENVLQEGTDASGGYLVPEEYDKRLIDVLSEENVLRSLATTITTSGEHKINIAATKPAASWIEEGAPLTFGDATFDQIVFDAHKLHVAVEVTASSTVSSVLIAGMRPSSSTTRRLQASASSRTTTAPICPSYQMGDPDRLLGYPVHASAYMPAAATGKIALAFGNYAYYNIGDRGTRSLQELKEFFAGNGMVAYLMKERVDSKLVLAEAVQLLKIKG